MHDFLLFLHNLMRWLVLIGGIASVFIGIRGWLGAREWSPTANKSGLVYTTSLDIQLLLGFLLYVISPITAGNFSNIGEAMGNSTIRFFLVEHLALMVLAVVIAHIGRSRSRKAEAPVSKYKNAAIFFGISLLLVSVGRSLAILLVRTSAAALLTLQSNRMITTSARRTSLYAQTARFTSTRPRT